MCKKIEKIDRKSFSEIPPTRKMMRIKDAIKSSQNLSNILLEKEMIAWQLKALDHFCEVFDCGVPLHKLPSRCIVLGIAGKKYIGIDWSNANNQSEWVKKQIFYGNIKFPGQQHCYTTYLLTKLANNVDVAIPYAVISMPFITSSQSIGQEKVSSAGFYCTSHHDWSWHDMVGRPKTGLVLYEQKSSKKVVLKRFKTSIRKFVLENSAKLKNQTYEGMSDVAWKGVIDQFKFNLMIPDHITDFKAFEDDFLEPSGIKNGSEEVCPWKYFDPVTAELQGFGIDEAKLVFQVLFAIFNNQEIQL